MVRWLMLLLLPLSAVAGEYPRCNCAPEHIDVASGPGAYPVIYQAGYSDGVCRALSLHDARIASCKHYEPLTKEEKEYVEQLLQPDRSTDGAGG